MGNRQAMMIANQRREAIANSGEVESGRTSNVQLPTTIRHIAQSEKNSKDVASRQAVAGFVTARVLSMVHAAQHSLAAPHPGSQHFLPLP